MKMKFWLLVLVMAWRGRDGVRAQGILDMIRLVPCPASAQHQVFLVPATTTTIRQQVQCYKLTGPEWKVDASAKTISMIVPPPTSTVIRIETPSGVVNGINRDFALANIPTGPSNARVHVSGLTLLPGVDFMLTIGASSAAIRFVVDPPMSGESFWAEVW